MGRARYPSSLHRHRLVSVYRAPWTLTCRDVHCLHVYLRAHSHSPPPYLSMTRQSSLYRYPHRSTRRLSIIRNHNRGPGARVCLCQHPRKQKISSRATTWMTTPSRLPFPLPRSLDDPDGLLLPLSPAKMDSCSWSISPTQTCANHPTSRHRLDSGTQSTSSCLRFRGRFSFSVIDLVFCRRARTPDDVYVFYRLRTESTDERRNQMLVNG
ncbi:hypothetical protein K523DRAFT_377991, partial [Schizophyllum commune Tattone D]